jgi:hypothetical protein
MTPTYDDFDDNDNPGTANSGIDPVYAELYGSGTGDEVAERQGGFEPIPAFGYYVVQPRKAIASFTQEKGSPRVQAQVEIVEGLTDTAGRVITDAMGIYFIVNRESKNFKTNEMEYLNDEDFAKKVTKRKNLLNRIAKVAKLPMSVPVSFQGDAIEQYASQFTPESPRFVIEIRAKKGSDGITRNEFVWQTAAALDEPILDKNGKPTGLTALDEARKKIADRDKNVASKGRTRTAGFAGRPSQPRA